MSRDLDAAWFVSERDRDPGDPGDVQPPVEYPDPAEYEDLADHDAPRWARVRGGGRRVYSIYDTGD